MQPNPFFLRSLEAGSHPVLCASSFPVLFPLKSLDMFHPRFLSNPGFPVPALTEVRLWFLSLQHLCPSQSCVPPSSSSTSLLLISSQLCFRKYPTTSFFMFFLHASSRCFPFQTFPLFADLVCWQFFTRHWLQLQKPA